MPSSPEAGRVIPPRLRRLAIASAAVALGTSVLGSAISPYLLAHAPILLLALAPEPRHLVLTAGLVPAWVSIPLVVVRRVVGLAALYAIGWVYGQAAVLFVEGRAVRTGRFLRWLEHSLERWGAGVLLVLPMPTVVIVAGVAGTRLRTSMLAVVLGQCFWTTATWFFGDAVLELTTPVVEFLARHVPGATLVCAVIIVATQARTWLRRRRAPEGAPPAEH